MFGGHNGIDVRLPNFLIVGAAKSGTTSLSKYLGQHPDIYMSPVKEPKYISSLFMQSPFRGSGDSEVERMIVKSYDQYCELFRAVKTEKAIGEASADNLYYYEKAISHIKRILGEVKIIVILRNPVDRSFSAYTHLVRDCREDLSFEKALEHEDFRKKNNWEFIWFYKDVGCYFNQVKAYKEHFRCVKVYLHDDFEENPRELIKDVYEFLEIDNSFVPDMRLRLNVSVLPKSAVLGNFLTQPNILKDAVRPILRLFMSDEKLGQLVESAKRNNLYKPRMKEDTRKYLKAYYREDILRLQDLINKDLSAWLR